MILSGYLPDYRFYINVTATAALSSMTDLILFSIQPNVDGSVLGETNCCLDGSHYEHVREAKLAKSDLKVFISIGGAGRSDAFSSITSDKSKRLKFIGELKELCQKQQFDGIDFDWEQPQTKTDAINYSQLLIEASTILHKQGILVSVALHPKQVLPEQVYTYIDRVNLMAYDMIQPRKNGNGYSHHSTYEDAIQAVTYLKKSGCPSYKIILGIPLYGRHIQNPGMVKTVSELMDMQMKQTGSLPDGRTNEIDGYQYDSPLSIKKKLKYVQSQELGGIFFWELGQDYRNEDEFVQGRFVRFVGKTVDLLYQNTEKEEL